MALASLAQAQPNGGTIQAANPNLRGDGTLSPAAAAAMSRGPLPMSAADVERKKAANRAAQNSLRSAPTRPAGSQQPAETGSAVASFNPVVVDAHAFSGLAADFVNVDAPTNATGAVGPTRYIQAVDTKVRIYNRKNDSIMATGALNQLAGKAASVNSFNPQIMWDPTTDRFYYVMDSIVSASDNKLSWGFSKTPNPDTLSDADWCKYNVNYGARFPDYPKLGDSKDFIIVGVNSFNSSATFVGSDLITISKPPAGQNCPGAGDFTIVKKFNLKDSTGKQVFTPVPSNQVDENNTGFVVARNGTLPSTKLWFFKVLSSGAIGPNAFGLTIPSYDMPPDASQLSVNQTIETLDARPTQAVQAINPKRAGTVHSFYVQHTVKHPTQDRSVVRWYEINPVPTTPRLLRSGEIGTGGSADFYYNAAISPDRRKDGATAQFGDSFVIHYNISSKAHGFAPRVVAGSSFQGGELTFSLIKEGVDAYRDPTCPTDAATPPCRWADYASAAPDPRPTTTDSGEVWGTNHYSAKRKSGDTTNRRTWIFALQP